MAHFAALKAVGESCRLPLQYYQNNITGTSVLLETMADNGVYRLVYSSSATVYGEPEFLPLTEEHSTGKCTNPYGKSKFFTEEILKDLCDSDGVSGILFLLDGRFVACSDNGMILFDSFRNGQPSRCGTSIQWEPIPLGRSERTRMASRIT